MLISPKEPILLLNHYPRALVSLMAQHGVSQKEMLLGTQIDPALFAKSQAATEATISYAQYGVLIMNAIRAYPHESLGLAFGKYLHITQHGMLGVAAMTSENLGGAIAILEKYYRLLSPVITLKTQVVGEQCIGRAEEAWDIGPLQVLAVETFFSGLYENCGFIVGELPPAEFYFRHSAPDYSHLYKDVFGDKCHFDCASDQIVFHKDWLERPLVWSNPVTCKQALAFCDQQLETINGHVNLLAKLRDLPVVTKGKTLPLDAAAQALNMSGRSLRRHLKALNTSYQRVVDNLKAELAEEMLRDSNRSVVEIATALGFGDVANFRKAFKRWLGKTPSEYRKALNI